VKVAWSTASETDNAYFDVERSLDGKAFTTIGTVGGAGTSTSLHCYGFLDVSRPVGVSLLYYRLRQVNTNGKATYSPVRLVILNEGGLAAQLQAYPNPAHEVVSVRVLSPVPTAPLQVFDAMGRLVRTNQLSPVSSETSLSLEGLPAGLYILRCGALSQRLTVH
jgi:hypothetical protein